MSETTQQVTFRLPNDLVLALDEAAKFGAETELGDPKTRAELVRRYLTAGLEADGFWPPGHIPGATYYILVKFEKSGWGEIASARPPAGARPELAARVLVDALFEAAFYDGGFFNEKLERPLPIYELRIVRDGLCIAYLRYSPFRRGFQWAYDVGALISGMKASLRDTMVEAFRAIFKLDTSPHRPNWTANMPSAKSDEDLADVFDEKRRG